MRIKMLLKNNLMVFLLMILTVASAASIICFSYGIYQNYNAIIADGDAATKILTINSTTYDKYMNSSVTKGMLSDCILSLSKETKKGIQSVYCQSIIKENVYIDRYPFEFFLRPKEMGFVDGLQGVYDDPEIKIFDDNTYIKGEKKIILGKLLYESELISMSVNDYPNDEEWNAIKLEKGQKTVLVNGEEYEIIGYSDYTYDPTNSLMFIPFTSLSNDVPLRCRIDGTNVFNILFYESITAKEYKDVCDAINKYMSGDVEIQPIDLTESTDKYYYKTIILISVIITLLSAINFTILYRFILENDKKKLNIYRLCGCTRAKAIRRYLFQCMSFTLPLFAITEVCYHKLILPIITPFFKYMYDAYSFKIYAVIFGIYSIISIIVFRIMMIFQIPKNMDDFKGALK